MKRTLQFLFVLMISMQLNAQEKPITGIVTSLADGLPLPGVNIIIKGTTTGVQTGFDGEYTINVNEGNILTFSFIGMITKEVVIGASNIVNVVLEEDSSTLDEVVITGYASKGKSIRIRGMSSVTSRSESVSKALSGRVSGVKVEDSKAEHDAYSDPQSGQLTAGEINDLEKWDDWLNALKVKEYKKIQKNWNFFLENKIQVSIVNEKGLPVNNVQVSLYNDLNEKIMTSRTDISGNVTLFKDLNKVCEDEYFIVQALHDNNAIGKKITNRHETINFVLNRKNASNDIDVMFTIDATGSMGDEISYLKSELKNIISRLDKSIDKKRVALTFYRDSGDEYVVKDFDFNEDIKHVKEVLSRQSAGGGGDYEEAVEKALQVSMSKSWNINAKSRLLFLLLDAPPHLNQENVLMIKEQIKIAQEKGIKIIPIVASGADKTVEFLMRFFSVSTNGTYVFLTDDSGIGNPHMKPTASEYKIEKLNDLIVRLIEKYAGVIG